MPGVRALTAAVLAASLLAACSSDDDAAPPATTTAVSSSVTDESAPAETPPGTVTSLPPVTTTRSTETSATSAPTTRAPSRAERLAARIPDGGALGVSEDWTERMLSSDLADVPADEVDPFNGLLVCPAGPVVPTDAAVWVERRFTGATPVDDVIMVRVTAIEEDGAAATERARRLAACTPASAELFVERAETEDGGTPVQITEVFGSATGTVPFPPALAQATGRADGITVSVAVLGLDNGVGFARQARAHLRNVLDTI